MGILEVLTIVFVVLKLLNVIDWSWWLVFSPMYVAVVLYTTVIIIQFKVWNRASKNHDKIMKSFWEDK